VGIRAGVRPGVRIGRGCTVGVGAAVVGDVADGLTVVGVPARAIR
jgi:acetyltransferase-like isoleucine patch superfamily enzyme